MIATILEYVGIGIAVGLVFAGVILSIGFIVIIASWMNLVDEKRKPLTCRSQRK